MSELLHCNECGHDWFDNMVEPECPNCGEKIEISIDDEGRLVPIDYFDNN